MRAKPLIAVMCLVLILGCAGGGSKSEVTEAGVEPGRGVKVTKFVPDYQNLASGDTFSLNLEVKNVGNAVAKGPAGAGGPAINLYRYGTFTKTSTSEDALKTVAMVLDPPDLEFNVPGQSDMVNWNLKAPDVSTEYPYSFAAQVHYQYETQARTEVTFLTRERLLATGREGGTIPNSPSESTVGPVEVRIEVPQEVVLRKGGTETGEDADDAVKNFTIKIVVENIGDGIVQMAGALAGTSDCTKKLGCVSDVYLTVPTAWTTTDAAWERVGNDYRYKNNLKLIGGDTGYVTCQFKVKYDGKAETDFEDTVTVFARAVYDYQIEATTDVVVKGKGL